MIKAKQTPYRVAAESYLQYGWSPVPLREGEKWPPASGFTGAGGKWVDAEQLATWLKKGKTVGEGPAAFEPGNVAFRLPPNVIGIDVDSYGSKTGNTTLDAAEAKWGTLPPTWKTTSKEGISGIRLFRVPEGLAWPESLTQIFGGGVEIIRWDHRYAVVSPSLHPDGPMYVWVRPDGTIAEFGEFPEVDDLAEMPMAWVNGLTAGTKWKERATADLDDEGVAGWLRERQGGQPCHIMDQTLRKYIRDLMKTSDDGGMHDVLRDGVWALVGDANMGHCGVTKALKKFRKAWMGHSASRRLAHQAEGEWKRVVIKGVQKAAVVAPEADDSCQMMDWNPSKPEQPPQRKKPAGSEPAQVRVEFYGEVDAIEQITKALKSGVVPDVYVRHGQLVRVRRWSQEGGRVSPVAQVITVAMLRADLARYAEVVKAKVSKKKGDDGEVEHELNWVEAMPSAAVCEAVLTQTDWEPVPRLDGIVSVPYLRADGSLNQTPGFDSASWTYYEPERELAVVPKPEPSTVAAAKAWLLDDFLGDFPWATPGDKANYVALLVTPILRGFVGGLTPFGVVTANAPGSGKSLLAEEIMGRMYRLASYPWHRREEERQKSITAAFADDRQVVVFDNVGDNDRVDSPALAKLLTARRWDDRKLGSSEMLSYANNRLWLATGNNITLGGDIASRTVLVRLNPLAANVTRRTGFSLGDLGTWLDDTGNQDKLMAAIMVLCLAWVEGGAPREEFLMRGFHQWVCAMGGFLAFHGVEGFLSNTGTVDDADEEADEWAAFLADLRGESSGKELTAAEIHGLYADQWGGESGKVPLPTGYSGNTPTVRGLGMLLKKKSMRFFNGLALHGRKVENTWRWRVLTEEELKAVAGGGQPVPGTGNQAGKVPGKAKPGKRT